MIVTRTSLSTDAYAQMIEAEQPRYIAKRRTTASIRVDQKELRERIDNGRKNRLAVLPLLIVWSIVQQSVENRGWIHVLSVAAVQAVAIGLVLWCWGRWPTAGRKYVIDGRGIRIGPRVPYVFCTIATWKKDALVGLIRQRRSNGTRLCIELQDRAANGRRTECLNVDPPETEENLNAFEEALTNRLAQ